MAAVEHREAIAHKAPSRQRASLLVLLTLAAAYALTVLVFYPGYSTVDARYVYADAMAWHFGDWQSPAMVLLWRLVDPIAPGASSMFLLTATLYWLAFVWRDVLFAVIWLAAAVLAFAAADRPARLRAPVQASALLLIALGVLLRPNAVVAAPFLAAYVIWPMRFDLKRTAILFLPALVSFYALVPLVYYGILDAERQNPLHSIAVFDLGGITHFSGDNQFPVSWSGDQTALLISKCYDPVRWDSYWNVEPCAFVMRRLERPDDMIFGTPRLAEAWRHALAAHPLAYLSHRATFMWQFLGRSNLVLPVWDWLDPASGYGHSRYFTPLVALHDALQPTLLFRPGLWLALAVAVTLFAWPARTTPAGSFAISVTVCATVYVMSFAVLGVAADFRYAYWCVLATIAGAVATVLARYAAAPAGQDSREPSPGSASAPRM
ncbi:MAG: hypothetical protein AUI16_15125 [Alphaproteobacteria bacterium 13_2_20CM_2_64_7]|nr:MAG: hypothetical protein AUI16_15125 [Alphaproteobacteria bacterium 13_2_20CM_2_64_7]